MNLTLSPQMKIAALVGLIAALGLGVGSMMLGRSQPSSEPVPSAPLKHFKPKSVVPAAPKKHAVVAKHAAPSKKAAAPAKAAPKPKAHKLAAVVPAVAENGLPGALDLLLHGHRVVIVALWDPEIPSDRYALLEAQAGARAANAGFFSVSILDERVAAPLTSLLGNGSVLPSPGVLVYKQPSTLMNRFDGFADRDAIAEAVANALMSETPPPGTMPVPAAPAAAAAALPASVPAP